MTSEYRYWVEEFVVRADGTPGQWRGSRHNEPEADVRAEFERLCAESPRPDRDRQTTRFRLCRQLVEVVEEREVEIFRERTREEKLQVLQNLEEYYGTQIEELREELFGPGYAS